MNADIFVTFAEYMYLSNILRWSKLEGYYSKCLIAQYFRNGAQSPVNNAILSQNERRIRNTSGNIRAYIALFRVIILASNNRVITIPRINYEKYVRNKDTLQYFGYYYNIPGMNAYSITPISSRCWYDNDFSITYRDNGEIILWTTYRNVKIKARLCNSAYSIVILEYDDTIKIINQSIISHNRVQIFLDNEYYNGYYSHGKWHTEHSIYYIDSFTKIGEIDKYYGYMQYNNSGLMFEYYLHSEMTFYNKDGRIIRKYIK